MISQARKNIPIIKAREILQLLQIKVPSEINPEDIAFYFGAFVQEVPLDGMDGNIVRNAHKAIISINQNLRYSFQKRYIIAHELGHFFLHPNARQFDTVEAKQSVEWSEMQATEEYEANLFAAELLMPRSMFLPKIKNTIPSFDLIEDLSSQFQTTFTATAVQYVLHTEEECFLVSSSKRQRLWFIASKNQSLQLLHDGYIHGYSCAYEVGPANIKAYSSKIEAHCWFEGFQGVFNSYITEEARHFISLEKTLSLLWIHELI